MAVNAAALETYDSITIREDLADAENMISPTETPFVSLIAGKNKATATKHEWPVVELGRLLIPHSVLMVLRRLKNCRSRSATSSRNSSVTRKPSLLPVSLAILVQLLVQPFVNRPASQPS